MHIMQSRRDFLATAWFGAAAGVLAPRDSIADEGPPETTTIRLRYDPAICVAPWYVGEDLLRAEGFTSISYIRAKGGLETAQLISSGELDFNLYFAAAAVFRLDTGVPMTVLAGVHAGCFELFAHDPIRTISDLRGKKIAIPEGLGSGTHLYLALMVANIGLNPNEEIDWVTPSPTETPMELFVNGRADAFLATPPQQHELRARKIGRVLINSTTDKPWSQYFCCMIAGNRDFVHNFPVATKRMLRAILKAADICAAEPERVAQHLVDGGFTERYDYALQTLSELPYDVWRELDPEDSLRFCALRLHEAGIIKSSPNQLIAAGTDWRFLNELKRELKT